MFEQSADVGAVLPSSHSLFTRRFVATPTRR